MTRKTDSGWRDADLNVWHTDHGFACPAAGMQLPMIEYDRGAAVGLVNYVRRGDALPSGAKVTKFYRAFGTLNATGNGPQLPFLTAVYDPRNWAMRLFPHNSAAGALVRRVADDTGDDGWAMVTEAQFAELLYAMRGRLVPDLFGYGVEFAQSSWLLLEPAPGRLSYPAFPCADMSARRRTYEPLGSAPMRYKVPCLDVDLAVVDQDDTLALVVDYKRMTATCDPAGTNARALASLWDPRGMNIPAFMTRYFGADEGTYRFETMPLNATAQAHLSYVLGSVDAPAAVLAQAVTGGWTRLSQTQWLDVLRVARDL